MVDPKLSVVIASVNGLPVIDECLRALEKQRGGVVAETIVIDCCPNRTAEHIRETFPRVKVFEASGRPGIPELRAIGFSHAAGDIIAVIEDHCIVAEDWAQETVNAHQDGYAAVGGAVENASVDRIVDWAAFFCEYSHAMLPIPDAEADYITGNNTSYRREVLLSVDESVRKNYWEFFLHDEMRKRGVRFMSSPRVLVYHKKEFGFLYFIAQRFHYSRSFAAMRSARMSTFYRLCFALLSPALPAVMAARITAQVLKKGRHYREFLLALPLLTVFLIAYAIGELCGTLVGPGESLRRVE